MTEESEAHRLIRNRPAAIIAAVLTGYVAALAIRSAFFAPAHHSRWLFPNFFSHPRWLFLAVQVAFDAYLLWLCIAFLRAAKDKERLVVAAWSLSLFLGPLEVFLSRSAAHLLEVVSALGLAAAFLVTIDVVLRQFSAGPGNPPTVQTTHQPRSGEI